MKNPHTDNKVSLPESRAICQPIVKGFIGQHKVSVMISARAPTSFIKRNLVERLNLRTVKVETIYLTSFLSLTPNALDEAAYFELEVDNDNFEMSAYIDDNIEQDVFLGRDPIEQQSHKVGIKDTSRIEFNTF